MNPKLTLIERFRIKCPAVLIILSSVSIALDCLVDNTPIAKFRASAASTTVVISEVQPSGNGGATDEFIEIYNLSSSTINLANHRIDKASASGTIQTIFSFPSSATNLGPGKHYLITGPGYNGAASGDAGYPNANITLAGDGQLAIVAPGGATIIDAVAWGSINQFVFGITDSIAFTASTSVDRSIERKPGSPGPNSTDTDVNTDDFFVQNTPNPQNSTSPTAVVMISFSASWSGQYPVIQWQTANEIDNFGFNLWRSENEAGPYMKINSAIIPSNNAGGMQGANYSFTDAGVGRDVAYYYKLESVSVTGVNRWHGPVSIRAKSVVTLTNLRPGSRPEGATLPARYANAQCLLGLDECIPGMRSSGTRYDRDDIRLLKSDADGIILELNTPDYRVEKITAQSRQYDAIVIEGFSRSSDAGKPQLPVKNILLGAPPDAAVRVQILQAESDILAGKYDILPVARPAASGDASLISPPAKSELVQDKDTYSGNGPYPGKLAQIISSGYLRHQRCIQLQLAPVQYNPVAHQLEFYRRMKVQLQFVRNSKAGRRVRYGFVDEKGFEGPLRNILLNYDSARRWRVDDSPVNSTDVSFLPSSWQQGGKPARDLSRGPRQQSSYKILVDQDCIYRVTYGELINAGLKPVAMDPRSFKLTNRGKEVAIDIVGQEDGSFDPGDYIEFYGESAGSKYSDTNVYYLTTGGSPGLRMIKSSGNGRGTVQTSFRDRLRLEVDRLYRPYVPMIEGADHWYWHFIPDGRDWDGDGAPNSASYRFSLRGLASESSSLVLRASLAGFNFGEHHTRIYLNDHLVGDLRWSGRIAQQFTANAPASHLSEGANVIKVEVPGDADGGRDSIFVNWFEIEYQRKYITEGNSLRFSPNSTGESQFDIDGFSSSNIAIFDITEQSAVRRIAQPSVIRVGERYRVRFSDSGEGKRYLALAADQIRRPLKIVRSKSAQLRSTLNGADYIIITHGNFYTEALRLAGHRAAQGLRTMVIDVENVYDEFSGGLLDPQAISDFLYYAYHNWRRPAPSYVLLLGDGNLDFKDRLGTGESNFIPPYLVMVDPWNGETASDNRYVTVSGDDILPDMHIGRLPVSAAEEARAVIDKIIGYERNGAGAQWNRTLLFIADNADSSGDFAALSDDLIRDHVPREFVFEKVYLGVNYATADEAKAAIISSINKGCAIINYIGHAAINQLAEENLLSAEDIGLLRNASSLPFLLLMSCYDGFFHFPGVSSTSESLLRADRRGSIGSWAPTGLGMTGGHEYLNRAFLGAVLFTEMRQLGEATLQGKLNLYAAGSYRELIDTYLLFGDPAMRLNLPAAARQGPSQLQAQRSR